jgi:3-phenylpropionate/trans-cinnamate dioxygenase ferredoxin reductase subunit
MTGLRRVVIVGNGIAGVTAADTLRTVGFEGELTIVGDERHAAYSRPALSKALLRDAADVTSHLLPPPAHGATELRGVSATGLDPLARAVQLSDGERLPYDGLVIATGCRARRLNDRHGAQQDDVHPDDAPHELTLRTLDDAIVLRQRITSRPSVVVIGGGPLGMEVASGAIEAGCAVTLVSQGAPLASQLGAHLSGVFVAAARAHGLQLVPTSAVGLERVGEMTRVTLADGATRDADLVVTAVGDRANVEWLASSGLLTDGALVVDATGRVRPDIAAAGDVATIPTPHGIRRVPLWSSAIEQGRAAATALVTGQAHTADPRPYFWTEQFGLSLKAVGHLPFTGEPSLVDGEPDTDRALWRWEGAPAEGGGAAAAVNYRIPIPRLRRLCDPTPSTPIEPSS